MPVRTVHDLEPLTRERAEEFIAETALVPSGPTPPMRGTVGLEIESHLVDFAAPAERAGWDRITSLAPQIESAAGRSSLTFEPGGQIELSGAPMPGIVTAVEAMRSDVQRVRIMLAGHDAGLALVGSDPVREPVRVNPRPRYAAMERHFDALGRADAGRTMMCSTAALQVNLDAGPATGWADRVALARQLGPTLTALSACSPWLAGRTGGHASTRELAWG
ncbi:MAG: glutamate-cysteine ligase family protein, partial [Jatrophihabitantaceae bacterium]